MTRFVICTFLLDIMRIMKEGKMIGMEHVACMGDDKSIKSWCGDIA
jgi:hypothetical protein